MVEKEKLRRGGEHFRQVVATTKAPPAWAMAGKI